MNKNWRNFRLEEVRWPDNQTSRLLAQAFKDAKVRVSKVWEKGNHKYILRVRAIDGNVNVKMELNVVSNVITMDTQGGHVRLGELQPGSRGRKLTKNLKMLSKLPSFGVAGFKGLKYKIESVNDVENIDEKSKASKEAEEQGLVHLGFGRYGPNKGDSATHVSMGGALKKLSGKKKSKKSDDKPQMGPGKQSGDKPQMGLKPFKTKATKIGGGTGVDADFLGEPPEGSREPDDVDYDEEPKELEKGTKVTAKWTGVTGDEQNIPDGEIEDTKYNEDGTVDSYTIRWNNGNNLINLSADKVKGEEFKEKRPGGKEAEDDYQKADQMMKKYAGVDIEKAEYWAKKKKQAADSMMGRTGKELDEKWMKEIMRVSNIKCV